MPCQLPSREGSIVAPGLDGGGEWGGAAVDPNGVMYVNGSETPWILKMVQGAGGGAATPSEVALDTTCSCARAVVVIACGGGKPGSKSDDVYVAFALPR